jgi:hypothetical protein
LRSKRATRTPPPTSCWPDLDEAFAPVESLGGFVGRAGLHDRAPRVGLRGQNSAHECHADAAPEEVRIDREPVNVDRLAVELPRHDSGKALVDERAEELFSARAQVFDGLLERRKRVGADQLGFDTIRATLNLEHNRRYGRFGYVELRDDGSDGRS